MTSCLTLSTATTSARLLSSTNNLNKPARSTRRGVDYCATRASTTWSLDGVGCAGARSGDEQLLRSYTTKSTNDSTNAHAPTRCPIKPIDLSSLCDSHHGRFAMQEAVFEMMDGQLFVTSVDYYRTLADTDDISGATKQWARNLNPMERMPMVRFFLFLVACQRAWSVITSQISAAGFSDTAVDSGGRSQYAKKYFGGGADYANNAVAVNKSSKSSSGAPSEQDVVMVDGRPLPAFNRWLLRPGSTVRLGGSVFEVHRNVHAHA